MQILRYLQSQSQAAVIGRYGVSVPKYLDYLHRPIECEALCLLEFVSRFKRIKLPKRKTAAQLENNEGIAVFLHKTQQRLLEFTDDDLSEMHKDVLRSLCTECGIVYMYHTSAPSTTTTG